MSSQSGARHPVGLYVLCVAELGERFAGYLLSAALVLYLNERLGMPVSRSVRVYGSFGALSYGLSLVGGLLTDRVLGCRRALVFGAVLLAGGLLTLALDVRAALWPALALLVAGNALFKPSGIAMVDRFCPRGDARREAGYRLLHIAINAGALLGPLASGAVRSIYSWRALFLLGACAMGLAVLACVLGWRLLPGSEPAEPKVPALELANSSSGSVPFGALIVVLLGLAAFAALHSQTGSTLLFWARDHTRRTVLGYDVPPEWSGSVLCILALGFLTALPMVLRKLRRGGLELSAPRQLGIGLLFAALAYLVMFGSTLAKMPQVSALWLLGCFVALELAEVTVSPSSMSLVTQLAPRRWAASAGGLWLVATAFGFWLGGELGARWERWPPARFFAMLTLIGLAAAALLAAHASRIGRATSEATALSDHPGR